MTTNDSNVKKEEVAPAAEADVQRRGVLAKAVGFIPTILVFAALGGIAYWGHHTGWSAPRFSQLAGAKSAEAKEDWCVEHNVPESRCIACNPALVGANAADWCREHGIAESKCTICHPEILTKGVAGDWCPEHGIPESNCTICHPEIVVKGKLSPSDGGATVTMVSAASDRAGAVGSAAPLKDSGKARPADVGNQTTTPTTEPSAAKPPASVKDPKTCQSHNLRVQFASGDAVKKAGVKLGQVTERPISDSLTANAEVQYNANRVAQVSSAVAGKVWRVEKEIGQKVKQGEVIALLDAAEVGKAKAEYLQALAAVDVKSKTFSRLKTSAQSGFRTEAELQEAEAAVKEAEIRVFNARQAMVNLGLAAKANDGASLDQKSVQFLGLPKELASTLDPEATTANLLPLTAPFDGIVIQRNVVAGEVVEASKPLFMIADTSRLWVTADIPLSDAKRVVLGQRVAFRPDGAPDDGATGEITWISTAVDDQTRTVKVRAEVANAAGQLLVHTFGKALITVRQKPTAVAVPNEAIQFEGCCNVTFVRLTDDIFQTRKVKLGASANGFTEVVIGLAPGEVVATEGSHVLKSEILKSAMGAGCTDGH